MNIEKIKLGFSTGVLFKTHNTKQALKIMRGLGYDIVELGFVKLDRIKEGWLDEISREDLLGFEHISLHAPVFSYGENETTKYVFEKINKIDKIRKLDTVVFHPDTVEDFSVFRHVPFSVAFENMDNRKETHILPKDFDTVFIAESGYKMVLDVNHIYTNDSSMELAKDFYEKFGGRISELHISGYAGYHEPFFETKQLEILKAIQNFNTPMIIESTLKEDELEKERNYILQVISDFK